MLIYNIMRIQILGLGQRNPSINELSPCCQLWIMNSLEAVDESLTGK
jgi:hypothetical protein